MLFHLISAVLLCIQDVFGQIPGEGKCYAEKRNLKDDSGCLAAHNNYRSSAGIPGLSWDSGLAIDAQNWSNNIASRRVMEHASSRNGAGENIFVGGSCSAAVQFWYAEKEKFSYQLRPFDSIRDYNVGHYTQIMWRNTQKVGCGISNNYVVCRYSPAGNYQSQLPY